MLGCEILYGVTHGAKVHAMVEAATDAPCPCIEGRACPLLPPISPAVPAPRQSIERAAAAVA